MSGLNSAIYSALTASFVLAGLTYIGLPSQSLTAVFGTAAEKGLEDVFLWQLIGTAVSMVVAPIAYTQQVYRHAMQGAFVCDRHALHSIVTPCYSDAYGWSDCTLHAIVVPAVPLRQPLLYLLCH